MFMTKLLKPQVLRKLREDAELGREDLALLMNWSPSTVVNRETKDCRITISEFEKLIMVTSKSAEDREARKNVLKQMSTLFEKLLPTPNEIKGSSTK